MQDCIFCRIIEKEATANILFENENCLVFTPLDSVSKGHVLVVPKVHYRDIFDIDATALQSIALTAKELASELAKKREATGINLLHASGVDAQQSVFHFHIHVIPRYPGDGLDLWIRGGL